jgi:hypothetical protein
MKISPNHNSSAFGKIVDAKRWDGAKDRCQSPSKQMLQFLPQGSKQEDSKIACNESPQSAANGNA